MKKIFSIGFLAATMVVNAQIMEWGSTRYGVSIGPTRSQVRNAHNPSGARTSFFGGAFAMVPIKSKVPNKYFIQTGVYYLGAGETGGKESDNAVYANNYISVPLYFKPYLSDAENEVFVLVGPKFNFLLNQNVKNPSRPDYAADKLGKANAFNIAASLGAGFSYKRMLEIYLTYDLGISNTYPDLIESWTGDPNTEKKKSEQVVSLGISYVFK